MTGPDLSPERVDELAEVIAAVTDCMTCEGTGRALLGWTDKGGASENQYGPCPSCTGVAQALAPLVARWVAEARAEGWDEGWDERDNDCSEPYSPPRRNPYRADPTEEQR